MSNFTPKEKVIIEKLLSAINSDTSVAIDVLTIGFHEDEDEINEMPCGDIFNLVTETIENSDFDEIKASIMFIEIEDFDMSLMESLDEDNKE